MKQTLLAAVAFGLVVAAFTASPSAAANKEHAQLMADLRMLQEQTQLLQNVLTSVTDTLKAVNTRLDQQTEATRKAFADQKLIIDNLSNDARVIREKLDDNNVRIGSLTQELDALRQQLQQANTRPVVVSPPPPDPASPGGGSGAATPLPQAGVSTSLAASPQRVWDAAYADYASGNYDLAVIGYESYVKSFPKSDKADDAQVQVCNSYLQAGKPEKAVEACDLAIRTYPNGDKIPEAYYRKGLALNNLKDLSNARSTFEELVQKYPTSEAALLGKQALERLKRPN